MNLWYHGTSVENALNIAYAGAILSPLEQEIFLLKWGLKKDPTNKLWEKQNPPQTLEEYALALIESGYAPRELEHRVKSISLAPFTAAHNYANHHENKEGGIILGLQLLNTVEGYIVFIPRKVALKGQLREIYLTPKAEQYRAVIEKAFRKYGAQIKTIPE